MGAVDPVAKFSDWEYKIEGVDKFGFPPTLRDSHYKTLWYDPLTWRWEHKYPAFFFSVGLGIQWWGNRMLKRSFSHALIPNMVALGLLCGASYKICEYTRRMNMREAAILYHYTELHPQDFEHLMNSKQKRKYKDILLPWYPNRCLNEVKGPRPNLDLDTKDD